MAQLMADVHTGEAVVDQQRGNFYNDSLRQLMKQSVYHKHGVTSEQVDSSFSWYGRNITYYMDVYDRTIEILEHRNIETGNQLTAEASLSIAGDSVDVWPYARYLDVNDLFPTKIFTFNFPKDDNWEQGDVYTLRAKLFNNTESGNTWGMATEYSNGTVEYTTQNIEGDGWKELNLITDSTLKADKVYGFMSLENRAGTPLRLDSLMLVRKRKNHDIYYRRYSSVKNIKGYTKAAPAYNDSVDE